MPVGTVVTGTTGAGGVATPTLSAGLKSCTLGDIRTAKVTFAIRNGSTWSPISRASKLPVGLVDPGDTTKGTAIAIVQYNIGNNDALDLVMAIIVTGNFASNDPSQDALVVVAKPPATSSIGICGEISNGTGIASFSSKANLQDISDPANPMSIDGGATLQVEMTDGAKGLGTNPTVGDTISLYMLKKNGGVWYANKLDTSLKALQAPVVAGIGDIIVK